MGWANCGYNREHGVWMGYAHDGICMEPGCDEIIDHGVSYACGGMHEGGELGCGRYFCGSHLSSASHPVDETAFILREPGSPAIATDVDTFILTQLCRICRAAIEAALQCEVLSPAGFLEAAATLRKATGSWPDVLIIGSDELQPFADRLMMLHSIARSQPGFSP